MALTDDGLIYSWGGTLGGKRGGDKIRTQGQKYEPTLIEFFVENKLVVKQIACGQGHSLAIAEYKEKKNWKAQLFSWGN